MDWDSIIGPEEPEEGAASPPIPPEVLDDLIKVATEEDLRLEKRIEEISSDAIQIPEAKTLADYPDQIPMTPVLIEGLLRKGRKGILTADSKAGKSFFAIEMALCVASGTPFLGRKCTKSKVCYFNYEIDEMEFMQRVKDVAAALGIPIEKFEDNFKVIHMRGLSLPLKVMKGNLIALLLKEQLYTKEPFSLIILDPIYKITAGDENSAKDVGMFCNDLDRITKETEAAIFYTHHHAKGDQGQKKTMDRGSGSGVFARDPDLMMDLIQLGVDGQTKMALQNKTLCDFWAKKLDETGKEWRKEITASEMKSSGALAMFYQAETGCDAASVVAMTLAKQQEFEQDLSKSRAFRLEFVVRSFETPEPQNIIFKYPVHFLDTSGALIMAEPESAISNQKKKDTPSVKEQKMDVFVETVDQLILNSADGYTTYSAIAEALEIDARTVTRRLNTLTERYEVDKSGTGRGAVAKVRFLDADEGD